MKVTLDARMHDSGGIGTYLQQLIPRISPHCDLHLIGEKKLQELYPKTKFIPTSVPIYSLKEQWVLPKIIPECDIFWSPHYNVPIFPIRAKKRIVTIHDVAHLALSSNFSWEKRIYARLMLSFAAKKSDKIITVSSFSKKEIVKFLNVDEKKIRVSYLAADAPNIEQDIIDPWQKKRYFLFVGSHRPHKNLKSLLLAFDQIAERKDIYLVLIGAYKKSEPFLKKHRNRILIQENISDRKRNSFYAYAQGLVFPSIYEGFGLPPLEAMAARCPVIASRSASIPEICGGAAIYVDPLDVNDIRQKMLQLLLNCSFKKNIMEQGSKRAQGFSWNKCAEQHIEQFKEIVMLSD